MSTDQSVNNHRGKVGARGGVLLVLLATNLLTASIPAWAAAAHYSVMSLPLNTGNGALSAPQSIVLGQNGTIYGVTSSGGQFNNGGLFSMSQAGVYTQLHAFNNSEGVILEVSPPADNFSFLTLVSNGTLVGVSNARGVYLPTGDPSGTSYTMSATGVFSSLHSFYAGNGEITSPTSIASGSDDNIFGLALGSTWANNTTTSNANLFGLNPDGSANNIYAFESFAPTGFALGLNDDMYVSLPKGTVIPEAGGAASTGDAILKVTSSGQGSVVHVLDPTEGQGIDEIIEDGHGNLYGSALNGGAGVNGGDGSVFRVSASGDFSVLHSFSSFVGKEQQGYWPSALVAGSDGNLYGVALVGGTGPYADGTFFRIASNGAYTALYSFGDSSIDGTDLKSIIQVGPRTLYGVFEGGPNLSGGVFKLVVPIQDDFFGVGESPMLVSGPGLASFWTADGVSKTMSIAQGYYPVAVGDFNGDGMADIVWTSAKHDLYVWFGGVNGFTSQFAGTYPDGWTLVGAGDVDGDGKDDLIWIDTQTHQFAYWLMNGVTRTGYHIVNITSGYYPAALGDFNGDGKLDIMWTSANNDLYVWLGDGAGYTSKYITTYPAGWRITGRGDLDGDGRDDLIWSSTDGTQWGYWLMNGASISHLASFSVPSTLAGYVIAGSADYNGDGLVDILWSNGSQNVLWSNQGSCSTTTDCIFAPTDVPGSLTNGQNIFNSALPSTPGSF